MTKLFVLEGFVSRSWAPIEGQIGDKHDLDYVEFYLDESVWSGDNPRNPFQLFNKFPFIRFKKRLFLFSKPFYFENKENAELRVNIFRKGKKTKEVLLYGYYEDIDELKKEWNKKYCILSQLEFESRCKNG